MKSSDKLYYGMCLVVLGMLLVGCTSNAATNNLATPTLEDTKTPTIEVVQPTTEPTREVFTFAATLVDLEGTPSTTSMSDVYSLENEYLKFRCLEVLNRDSFDRELFGTILFSKGTDYFEHFLNLSTGEDQLFHESNYYPRFNGLITSPRGNSFLYYGWELNKFIGLVFSGEEHFNFEIPGVDPSRVFWLNDEKIVLVSRDWEMEFPGAGVDYYAVVYDTTNGNYVEFHPEEYPGINTESWYSVIWWEFNPLRFVMDPTLTRVVYPTTENGNALSLWDQENSVEITRIHNYTLGSEVGGLHAGVPSWSPDGTRFITSAPLWYAWDNSDLVFPERSELLPNYEHAQQNLDSDLTYKGGYEIVGVDRDGKIERLSYITIVYNAVERDFVWSPDGKKIAFRLGFYGTESYDFYGRPILAVLDVESGVTTSYCLEVDFGEPIWSPDSKQILIHQNSETVTFGLSVILVDIEDEFAVKLLEDDQALGWYLDE